MKGILSFIFLLLTFCSIGQTSRSELANSRLYAQGTFFDGKNEFIGLQTRAELADTIINGIKYRKFQVDDFTDYAVKRNSNYYYEGFTEVLYTLLDKDLNVVHKINYHTTERQQGTIFGRNTEISLEFIDTRNTFPRDTLNPSENTPRRYFQSNNAEIYLIIIPDLKTLAVSSNGQFYTKELFGDIYNDITEGLQNSFQTSTVFDIQKGDGLQLFYRRKWYNDTTNVAEYEDKQFKNVEYFGDTVVNTTKALKFKIDGYNYLSGAQEGPEQFLVFVTDSGYSVGYQFVPFQNLTTELRLFDIDGKKELFLQGVSFDTSGTNIYWKIAQSRSNEPYRYYILPFFPMPFVEFGNVQGIITYSKIKGIEKGVKKERTYITTSNNIRELIARSNFEVDLQMYFVERCDIEVLIQDFETNKTLGKFKSTAKKGLNSFIINTDTLVKDKEYGVQINYKGSTGVGSISNSVTAKY